MTIIDQAVAIKSKLAAVNAYIPDDKAPEFLSLYDRWAPGKSYKATQIIVHGDNDALYRVETPVTLSLEHQPPGAPGMLAVYRPINVTASGTLESPIPWVMGMDCRSGLYYSFGGAVYLCKADMIPCVWAPDSGIWQWEVQNV